MTEPTVSVNLARTFQEVNATEHSVEKSRIYEAVSDDDGKDAEDTLDIKGEHLKGSNTRDV